ncbi:MAG: trypsin-like peptidase domain-containing protein [Candidatus Nealsonbacteria bacterium]|nr:trypsin-like peptidase domain-containing protein [Candidatus Nealsonbacteria bacterium]
MNKRITSFFILLSIFLLSLTLGVLLSDNVKKIFDTEAELLLIEDNDEKYQPFLSHEETVISVVENVSPAVVSIVVKTDIASNLSEFDRFFGLRSPRQRQEISGGTGFIISDDGTILTNRHVVENENAKYLVFTNDGSKFEAKVLARDPINDLAIIKIESDKPFATVKLGDSDKIRIGQSVVAIGNSLGEFRNTVSVGVVSGLGRSISATDGRTVQVLEDVIQTDAAINRGNSGGPLLNLRGEVIGINTAMALDAQNIGFSIPINKAKRMMKSIETYGEIVYPFLGVRYIILNESIQQENNLSVNYGAWVKRGNQGERGVELNSAAEDAGLQEGDIILEFNSQRIDKFNSLAKIIMKYYPGDEIVLTVLRNGNKLTLNAVLGERRF